MRTLGLDLGIKTLGVAISDKTNSIASPLKTIFFENEKYSQAIDELRTIITEYNITDIALGLPKNMDNSLGFASQRSMNFKKMLEELSLNVHLVDERLTSVEAINILKNNGVKGINKKKVVDEIAATIILESYLRGINR